MESVSPITLLLLLLCSSPVWGVGVSIDPGNRYQTMEGWGVSVFSFLPRAHPVYADPDWRKAFVELGLNILRVPMHKEVLVNASGNLDDPVNLVDDLATNVALFDLSIPRMSVSGNLAVWLKQNALEPDRVKISGSPFSPPHWMKLPTYIADGEPGAGSPMTSGFVGHTPCKPDVNPMPWLSHYCQTPRTGDSIGGRINPSPANLTQLARYLAAYVTAWEQYYGVPFYVISLQNESTYQNPFDSVSYRKCAYPPGNEECYWQYADALKAVKDYWTSKGLTVKAMGPHVANVGWAPCNSQGSPQRLYEQMRFIDAVIAHSDPDLDDFLSFWNSNLYMGTNQHRTRMWAAYYHGKANVPAEPSCPWERYLDNAWGVGSTGKPLWGSEVGLSPTQNWLEGGVPGDGAINTGLRIFNAINFANLSAYVYWQLSDANSTPQGCCLLPYAPEYMANPLLAKKYASFKHFSRYVRPGARRISAVFDSNGKPSLGGADEYDTYHSINISAFLHETDQRLTIVIFNMRSTPYSLDVDLGGVDVGSPYQVYLTTDSVSFERQADLPVSQGTISVSVPAYSAVTVTGGR